MKFERVTYTKTFPTGPYLNEKIGVEIQLDETDEPEFALDMAKRRVELWHKENNPHLDHTIIGTPLPILEVQKGEEFDLELEKEILKMEKCKNYIEAETFIAASPFKYNLKLKELLQSKPHQI